MERQCKKEKNQPKEERELYEKYIEVDSKWIELNKQGATGTSSP